MGPEIGFQSEPLMPDKQEKEEISDEASSSLSSSVDSSDLSVIILSVTQESE